VRKKGRMKLFEKEKAGRIGKSGRERKRL